MKPLSLIGFFAVSPFVLLFSVTSMAGVMNNSLMPERMPIPPNGLSLNHPVENQAATSQRNAIIAKIKAANERQAQLARMSPVQREQMEQNQARQNFLHPKNPTSRLSTQQMYRNYMQSGSIYYGPHHMPATQRIPLKKGETIMQGIQNEAYQFSGIAARTR